ncbi:MAG: hypothetical protein ABIH99_02970 [Candidatus Micrarchaeota archaeon]
MKIKKVIVIANNKIGDARKREARGKLKREVIEFLEARGVGVVEEAGKANAVVTIGGDGTILYVKQKIQGKPIFAIGGKFSAICQTKKTNWKKPLERAIARGAVEKRSMLACSFDGKKSEDALNEICVRNRSCRAVWFELTAGKKKFVFRADGIIFATPTGSTAYAYSCGGKRLARNARGYEIVAVAPYRREFKPLVINEREKALLRVKSHGEIEVVVDGQFGHKLRGNNVLVFKSSRKTGFLKA